MVCQCLFAGVGYATAGYVLFKVLSSFYRIFYPYVFARKFDLLKKSGGKWAVVTASTNGIGRAYAVELGRRGFNVFLVARKQSKLDRTKKEVQEAAKDVEVRTFTFDFTAGTLQQYEPLLAEIKKLDVGVLINNVGLSYEYPDVIHKIEGGLSRAAQVSIVNTLPATILSTAVLGKMNERKSGIIVNLSSSAAYDQMPMWAVYSATKQYTNWLSGILRKEYGRNGILIQTLCPMLVATKMSKARKTSFFAPDATAFAKSALNSVGHAEETTGYFSHQVQLELMHAMPSFLREFLVNNATKGMRAGALRKKEKASKSE